MSELSDRLARLAQRGTERGADAVFAAAQADAEQAGSSRRFGLTTPKLTVMTAIAASVMLLAGVAGAIRISGGTNDSKRPTSFAAGSTTTSSTTTDATVPPTTIKGGATKVFLASTRLVPFNQCPALASYARGKALDTVGPYGLPGGYGGRPQTSAMARAGGAEGDTAAGASPPAASAPAGGNAGVDYSTTNVQEAGIDEPDSVKTDGKTVFAVANGKVFATAAANPELIGSIAIQNARELLLVGNRLIVISDGGVYAADFGGGAGGDARASMIAPGYYRPSSRFSVIDVSDPRAMRFTGSYDVEGGYLSARLVDGVARIVVRSYPNLAFSYPTDSTPEANAAATERNRDVIRSSSTDAWLPHFTVTDASGAQIVSRPLSSCADSYRPPGFSGFGMLSVVSFNVANPGSSHATSVMADGDIVYASPTRLYVATNQWSGVTDNSTVQPSANTLVHSFDISDPANAEYRVSGRVRGTALNQFSLSEHAGVLRIATTDAAGGSESFMTVMQDAGDSLQQIGQVGGLGKGERIFAVRFIDKTAYVVTFRQVDPLYVIDLGDPTRPKVVGELKITGYSAYLHPIGPGLLLGIGQEATEEGRRVGVQASVFDVSNPANPRVVARKVLEQGSTAAEFDHHAFLYWAPTKLAVIPLSTYTETQNFNGAVGLRIGSSSIDEVGRMQPPRNDQYGGAQIERSLVIGNRIFATSYTGVLVSTLDSLSQTAWVAYPASEPQPQRG